MRCARRSLSHDYIGTEHVLLGLARESESVASGILRDCNADSEKVRYAVLPMLAASDVGPTESRIPADDRADDDHGNRVTVDRAGFETYASG